MRTNVQTNALIEESHRLRSTAKEARSKQEKFRQDMEERLLRQEKIMFTLQQTSSSKSTTTGITSPIKALLDTYYDLDEDSKKALMTTAISTNNMDLQRALLSLRQNQNNPGSLAKLAKDLIKLADTYKVPELRFDEQAKKRRYNYHTWISKLRPILAMFSQTSSVLTDDTVTPFSDPTCIGNKALYLLIGSRVDGYFQRAIKPLEGKWDKALELIKLQCANVNALDKHHFHHLFTSIRIKDNESATSYLRQFVYAKTEAEGTSNVYTEH